MYARPSSNDWHRDQQHNNNYKTTYNQMTFKSMQKISICIFFNRLHLIVVRVPITSVYTAQTLDTHAKPRYSK